MILIFREGKMTFMRKILLMKQKIAYTTACFPFFLATFANVFTIKSNTSIKSHT